MPLSLSNTKANTRNIDDAESEALKEEKHELHVQIPKSTMKKIKNIANEEDCTLTDLVLSALEMMIIKKEKEIYP